MRAQHRIKPDWRYHLEAIGWMVWSCIVGGLSIVIACLLIGKLGL